ncbi:MAG: TetR/AcrR family transcriptional regulator [bacterium]
MNKGHDTKHSILVMATRLASRIGLQALTIGRLATEMDMSKSGLFAHFGSKESLQLELLQFIAANFLGEVVRPAFLASPGEPRIQRLFENWLDWVKVNHIEGGCPFVQATTEFDDQPGPLRDCLEETQKIWLDGLAESARRAQVMGHFRSDLDPEQFAFEFYSLLLGYHHAFRMLRDPRAEDHVRVSIAKLLKTSHP